MSPEQNTNNTPDGTQPVAVSPQPNESQAPMQQPVAPDTAPSEPAVAQAVATAASDVYGDIVRSIISSQEGIIGPLAVQYAGQVEGLSVDWSAKTVTISGEPSKVVDELISQYQNLFGQISVEVCKEAASRYVAQLPQGNIPALLR